MSTTEMQETATSNGSHHGLAIVVIAVALFVATFVAGRVSAPASAAHRAPISGELIHDLPITPTAPNCHFNRAC